MNIRLLAAAAALALSAGAQAATVFTDNFNSDAQALSTTPAGWTVTGGTVDIIPLGTLFQLAPTSFGNYVDLDGSTFSAGLLSTTVLGSANGTYTLTFDLAGSQRNTAESVFVTFGNTSFAYNVASGDPFKTFTLTTTVTGGPLELSFQNLGKSDNIGALLDDVSVSAVPEAGSLSMMLAGVAALGFAARRRRV